MLRRVIVQSACPHRPKIPHPGERCGPSLKEAYLQTKFSPSIPSRTLINTMKLANQIKPISYLKAHAADVVRDLAEQREPLIITQNGEAKMVLQDIESYEETQETLALLKILALGSQQMEKGEVTPVSTVLKRLRDKTS